VELVEKGVSFRDSSIKPKGIGVTPWEIIYYMDLYTKLQSNYFGS